MEGMTKNFPALRAGNVPPLFVPVSWQQRHSPRPTVEQRWAIIVRSIILVYDR